jgi:hypothetical protein
MVFPNEVCHGATVIRKGHMGQRVVLVQPSSKRHCLRQLHLTAAGSLTSIDVDFNNREQEDR